MATQPVESVFARSWELLTKNWILIVPGVVIGLVFGVIGGLLTPVPTYGDPTTNAGTLAHTGAAFVSKLVLGVLGLLAYVVTQCYTVGMAGAAWERGRATLADGADALRRDAGNVVGAVVGLILIGFVALILAFPTFGLAMILFFLFMLYTIPAAVVGNLGGFRAIRESVRIARTRFVPTLIIGVLLFVLTLIGALLAIPFAFAPLLGPIVSSVISQAVVSFATLVIVGEYLNLRGTSTLAPPV